MVLVRHGEVQRGRTLRFFSILFAILHFHLLPLPLRSVHVSRCCLTLGCRPLGLHVEKKDWSRVGSRSLIPDRCGTLVVHLCRSLRHSGAGKKGWGKLAEDSKIYLFQLPGQQGS